jgi:hypothetical protein
VAIGDVASLGDWECRLLRAIALNTTAIGSPPASWRRAAWLRPPQEMERSSRSVQAVEHSARLAARWRARLQSLIFPRFRARSRRRLRAAAAARRNEVVRRYGAMTTSRARLDYGEDHREAAPTISWWWRHRAAVAAHLRARLGGGQPGLLRWESPVDPRATSTSTAS